MCIYETHFLKQIDIFSRRVKNLSPLSQVEMFRFSPAAALLAVVSFGSLASVIAQVFISSQI